MGVIERIKRWFRRNKRKQCLLCFADIDVEKDVFSIIQYRHLDGEADVYVCEHCSMSVDDNSFDE